MACGLGRLRLSETRPAQGASVLLELGGEPALPGPSASWAGRDIPFWREEAGDYRAFLGVDVEQEPGRSLLDVRVGDVEGCSVPVEVRDGGFAIQRLTVPRRYVDLGPEDLARALAEKDRLEALFSLSSPQRLWQRPLRAPVEGVEPRQNFGRRRILNGEPRSPHSGVDFPAPRGAPVSAIGGGRVVLVDSLFFTGRTVIVDHGLGLYSVYAHLSKVFVDPAEPVEGGSRLGLVGATGRVTGPHLHLSVRLGLARVDPRQLLALLGEAAPGSED